MALTDKLTAIAAAIREKGGTSDLLTLDAMPGAIAALEVGGGGADLPAEAFSITGDCSYLDFGGSWDWFFNSYKDQIKITDVTNAVQMFKQCNLEKIPSITLKGSSYGSFEGCYVSCINTKEIGDIVNFNASNVRQMFMSCQRMRALPQMTNINLTQLNNGTTSMYAGDRMFQDCWSLRTIDPELLKKIYNKCTNKSYSYLGYMFAGCYTLDEINSIYPTDATITSNFFTDTFAYLYRVKNITFTTSNGNVYSRSWKGQTIPLYNAIGWLTAEDMYITGFNSGITADKKVTGDASYQALKNDPDWYTVDPLYSRFNHDSAVNFINSLPNTSAYSSASPNVVQFRSDAGQLTDGGAIGTLTEEEIAVATAKGWTITYKT